jgi:hypothetical protein
MPYAAYRALTDSEAEHHFAHEADNLPMLVLNEAGKEAVNAFVKNFCRTPNAQYLDAWVRGSGTPR